MGDVVGIKRASDELVTMLEGLLHEAKMGRLSSVAAVVLRDDDADFDSSDKDAAAAIAAFSAASFLTLFPRT